MRHMLALLAIGGIGYYLWQQRVKRQAGADTQTAEAAAGVKPKKPLPLEAKLTSRVMRTHTGGKPGEEVVGFAVRDWAEIMYPTGVKDWVEIETLQA